MITVHKQKLALVDVQVIEVPRYARMLHIGLQRGMPCIWYQCDTDEPMTKMTIRCYGTGHPINEKGLAYFGTLLLRGDNLVLHYFVQNL